MITKAKKIETWDNSSTTQSDDENTGIYRTKPSLTTVPHQDKLPTLNGTTMFTTAPPKYNLNGSNSEDDEDSIEVAVKKLNTQKPSSGIQNLVNQQPLLTKKSTGLSWDDSRPLSADLTRNTIKAQKIISSPYDSDDDSDKKSSTIVRSPLTGGALSHLVQPNIRPTETTGLQNLPKIIDDVKGHASPTIQKQ
jgi:hypothetical protein